jgi:hypothetical protein
MNPDNNPQDLPKNPDFSAPIEPVSSIATSDPRITQAPAAKPPVKATSKKSNLPTYFLIALALIAVILTTIAFILSIS